MSNTLFIIGAGFNLDANSFVSAVQVIQPSRTAGLTHEDAPDWELENIPLGYPNVNDLVKYGLGPEADLFRGAEELFTDAYGRHDWVVLKRLTIIIRGLGDSTSVAHVHGSLYLYPIDFDVGPRDDNGSRWLSPRSDPRIVFDPDSLGSSFPRYTNPNPGYGFGIPEARFIPPVSDMADSVEQTYYKALFEAAIKQIRKAEEVIAINYCFAESDRPSYDHLLTQLFSEGKRLVIVYPSAIDHAHRLLAQYHEYSPSIVAGPSTFAGWVAAEYPKGGA